MATHTQHYTSDDYIGAHHTFMRQESFMAVSSLILSIVACDSEDHQYWNARAVEARMVWC